MTLALNPETQFVIFANEYDFARAMFQDAIDQPNVQYRAYPFVGNGAKGTLYKIHGSSKANSLFTLPFQNKWNHRLFDQGPLDRDAKTVFVYSFRCVERMLRSGFVYYARQAFPQSIHVVYWDDIVKPPHECFIRKMHETFDFVFTYDRDDADKYGFRYYPSFLSYIEETGDEGYSSDVFFVGRAKNRLPAITEAFEALTNAGLDCRFHIVGAKGEQHRAGGLSYGEPISYKETLAYIKGTKCILDIAQKSGSACTLRPYEALIYRKRLLSDNPAIRRLPFYDERVMRMFSSIKESEIAFVKDAEPCSSKYDISTVSPIRFLNYLDEISE